MFHNRKVWAIQCRVHGAVFLYGDGKLFAQGANVRVLVPLTSWPDVSQEGYFLSWVTPLLVSALLCTPTVPTYLLEIRKSELEVFVHSLFHRSVA